VSEESVEHSPKKSVRHASRELEMSTLTVWRVLQNEALSSASCILIQLTSILKISR
jgi:hypothetical protein